MLVKGTFMKEEQENMLNGVRDLRGWGSSYKIWRAPPSVQKRKEESRKL